MAHLGLQPGQIDELLVVSPERLIEVQTALVPGAGLAAGTLVSLYVIRRAVAADSRNWKVARNYSFSERVDLRRLDAQGHVDSEELKTYIVRPLEGSSYRLLAARDDKMLYASPAERMIRR